jgi:hypothetical protein
MKQSTVPPPAREPHQTFAEVLASKEAESKDRNPHDIHAMLARLFLCIDTLHCHIGSLEERLVPLLGEASVKPARGEEISACKSELATRLDQSGNEVIRATERILGIVSRLDL